MRCKSKALMWILQTVFAQRAFFGKNRGKNSKNGKATWRLKISNVPKMNFPIPHFDGLLVLTSQGV